MPSDSAVGCGARSTCSAACIPEETHSSSSLFSCIPYSKCALRRTHATCRVDRHALTQGSLSYQLLRCCCCQRIRQPEKTASRTDRSSERCARANIADFAVSVVRTLRCYVPDVEAWRRTGRPGRSSQRADSARRRGGEGETSYEQESKDPPRILQATLGLRTLDTCPGSNTLPGDTANAKETP